MKVTIEVPNKKDIDMVFGLVADFLKQKDRKVNEPVFFTINNERSGVIRESHKGNISCRINP
ncbi:hypothetical protein PXH59_03455 [Xenorhabdus sp. SF857]|uniref:hypothetical protein n=1 Tax=Xenorhabdus bakwenae TaxID=3026967 RepID=UPI002557F536|nr:hypothetical protein [Xenorhabdus sp. SF857]WFQ80237.1 hypothetical protein PXH59_03455 [Xenorhabdus sp. SF857]